MNKIDIKNKTNLLIDNLNYELLHLPQKIKHKTEQELFQDLQPFFDRLAQHYYTLDGDNKRVFEIIFKKKTLILTNQSMLYWYFWRKPDKYKSDIGLMELLWQSVREPYKGRDLGTTDLGKIINHFFFYNEICLATIDRVKIIAELISSNNYKKTALFLCGAAVELEDALEKHDLSSKTFYLFEDADTIKHLRLKFETANTNMIYRNNNILKSLYKKEAEPFDIVFTCVLNFFSLSSSKKIVAALWENVASGGKLVIANILPDNTARFYFDITGYWKIHYKTESDMRSISEDLSSIDKLEIKQDKYKVYQYLYIHKT